MAGRTGRRWWRQGRVVAAVAAVALAAGACGGGSGAADGAASGVIDRNATLRMAWTVPAIPLDPHTPSSATGQAPYISPVYDRLTQIGEGPEAEPMLATAWEFAPDGRSATFTLRDGVRFTDGTALDATAVKASLDRARTLPNSTVKGQFAMVDDVTVVDPRTVRIATNRPAADLPYVLASGAGSIISPAALDSPDLDTVPVGSGPYKVVSVALGDKVVYERNPDYWDPEAQKAAKIELSGIANDNARLSALRSGQVDAILTKIGQYDQASELGGDFGFHSYDKAAQTYDILLNTERPGVDQVKVRQALNYAVDREGLDKGVLDGQCPATTQPITTGYEGHLDSLPVGYTHDPGRAKQLLAEAGLPNGIDLKIAVPAGLSPQDRLAPALQAQLGEAGFRVTLDSQDSVQVSGQWRPGAPWDGWIHTRIAGPTPAMTLRDNYLASNRFPGPLPQEVRDAVNEAFDPHLSDTDRAARLQDASRVVVEQALDVPLCAVPTQFAYDKKVVGLDGMGVSQYSGVFDLRYVGVTTGA
jgi:peptide/nickel transport system substrate-binding protein